MANTKATDTDSRKPIDIWMVSYQRRKMTANAINYLYTRTDYPYRLFVIDNHSTDGTKELLEKMVKDGRVFLFLRMSRNIGIHMAHNIGLSLVDSKLCISTDNDIYVPDVRERDGECWLTQLVNLMQMKENRNYSAIALQPHVFIGAKGLENAENGVFEVPMAGAHMRMMRTDVVKKAGGWEHFYNATRNHEEKTICSRIQTIGGKVGYAENLIAFHDFGDDNNWGYKDIPPHDHGHRIPGKEIHPEPDMMAKTHQLNPKTWQKK